jgi:hypothetical protein
MLAGGQIQFIQTMSIIVDEAGVCALSISTRGLLSISLHEKADL